MFGRGVLGLKVVAKQQESRSGQRGGYIVVIWGKGLILADCSSLMSAVTSQERKKARGDRYIAGMFSPGYCPKLFTHSAVHCRQQQSLSLTVGEGRGVWRTHKPRSLILLCIHSIYFLVTLSIVFFNAFATIYQRNVLGSILVKLNEQHLRFRSMIWCSFLMY